MISYVKVLQNNHDFFLEIPKTFDYNLTAFEAAQHTVKFITQNYPPPYTLCLTGGIDSQSMLYSWIRSGEKFQTFSAIYNDNLNYHDLENLVKFSMQYKCPVHFHNFNIIDFFLNEHKNYALTYRCGSPHMCVFMKFIEIINCGTVIFSGEFKRDGMIPFVDKNNFSIYRYAKTTGRSVVPWFFLETPEIYSSFKLLPNSMHRANILTHRKDKRAGDFFETLSIMNESKDKLYKRKCETYTMNGFPVIPQIQKFTGFEKLKDVFDEKYKHLVTIQDKLAKITTQSSTRTFDLLYRNKYEAMFQHDKYEVYEK